MSKIFGVLKRVIDTSPPMGFSSLGIEFNNNIFPLTKTAVANSGLFQGDKVEITAIETFYPRNANGTSIQIGTRIKAFEQAALDAVSTEAAPTLEAERSVEHQLVPA